MTTQCLCSLLLGHKIRILPGDVPDDFTMLRKFEGCSSLERPGTRKAGREILPIEELVEREPGENGETACHHLLNHHVEVEHGAEEHEVPKRYDCREEAEHGPHVRGVLRVERAKMDELVVLQLSQRSFFLLIVRIHPPVLLIPQEVLYFLPSQIGLSFLVGQQGNIKSAERALTHLDDDEVAEDENEGVPRDVKALPVVTVPKARFFPPVSEQLAFY